MKLKERNVWVRVDDDLKEKSEKFRESVAQGMYRDVTEVSRDMKAKYGL